MKALLVILASWYGPGFHGKTTASGEVYNMYVMTAAHKTLPFGTSVKVSTGIKSIIVRINDRGPFIDGRDLDLSKAAAKELGMLDSGLAWVTMRVVK